jgi:hypothetical protein
MFDIDLQCCWSRGAGDLKIMAAIWKIFAHLELKPTGDGDFSEGVHSWLTNTRDVSVDQNRILGAAFSRTSSLDWYASY